MMEPLFQNNAFFIIKLIKMIWPFVASVGVPDRNRTRGLPDQLGEKVPVDDAITSPRNHQGAKK